MYIIKEHDAMIDENKCFSLILIQLDITHVKICSLGHMIKKMATNTLSYARRMQYENCLKSG